MTTQGEIRQMIIEQLAGLKRTTPAAIETKLAEGERVGSHYFVRCLPKIRRGLGLELKANKELSRAMRTVDELAAYIHAVALREAA